MQQVTKQTTGKLKNQPEIPLRWNFTSSSCLQKIIIHLHFKLNLHFTTLAPLLPN